jgi:outer membrane lipoprotein carrier protein
MTRFSRALTVASFVVFSAALATFDEAAHAQGTGAAPKKAAPATTTKGKAKPKDAAAPKPSATAPAQEKAAEKPADKGPEKQADKGGENARVATDATPKSGDAKGKLPEAQVAAEVARVQAIYEKVRAFRAHFKQDYWVKAYDQRKKSTGAVLFARPGKMSWSYDEPKGNRVVSDGKLLRVYEEGSKQLYEQPVDKSQYPQALGFLTGESKLSETFTFEGNDGASMSFPGGVVLVATPKQPLATVQKVLLYVDAATHYVRRVLLLDAQGNRNRFDFEDVKLDDAFDAREFVFAAPAGTTVIHP